MNEPSSASTTKAVTPPIAPVPPAFGQAPTRPAPAADAPKVPPTGPRALTEDRQDRPVSSGQAGGATWAPPSGPSKSISPTIPTGPRAQQMQKQPRPSSKQWINPALVGNKGTSKVPESPKVNRSQSFASPTSRPFSQRPESYSSRHNDDTRRPRSSGAGADGEGLRPLRIPEPGDARIERGTQSARASIDRDMRNMSWVSPDMRTGGVDVSDRVSVASAISPTAVKTVSPTVSRALDQPDERPEDPMQEDGEIVDDLPAKKKRRLNVPGVRYSLPPKAAPSIPTVDQSSDSDDEDMGDWFDEQIAEAESKIQKLGDSAAAVPTEIVARYANITHEALVKIANEKEGLKEMLGQVPGDIVLPTEKAVAPVAEMTGTAEIEKMEAQETAPAEVRNHTAEPDETATFIGPEPQPKVEEMDVDSAHVPIPTVEQPEPQDEQGDVAMEEAQMNGPEASVSESEPVVTNGVSAHDEQSLMPPVLAQPATTATNSPTPMLEEEDDSDVEVDSVTLELVRADMQTPPLEELPCYDVTPWQESKKAMKSMQSNAEVENYIAQALRNSTTFARADQDEKRMEYKANYEAYLRFTLSDDPVAVKSRDFFNKANAPIDGIGPMPAGNESKSEGRRAGRFATERDIERIMAQSLVEAKEKEERETRAEKLKHPKESEAVIPDMYWTDEDHKKELFYDMSGFLETEKLVANWQVLPPQANFTDEEAEQFEKAYLEFPKQWGKIAEQVPNRDFHACIQYYYLKKSTLNLKEKLKKQPKKRRKGKTKARSSALAYELGNPDEHQDESTETGENGERRRPRRAAAPTWDFEKPAESAEGTPAATPGGRRGPGPKTDANGEKVEKPRRQRKPKDKEPKVPKTPQVLAPTPAQGGSRGARSRSNSKVPPAELLPTQNPTAEMGRVPLSFEPRNSPLPTLPPSLVPVPGHSLNQVEKAAEIMAPPSLRPEPIPAPLTSNVATFEFGPHTGITGPAVETERSSRPTPASGASSYWSVVEQSEFTDLLRSFGTDWTAISQHMTTKTPTMVSTRSEGLVDQPHSKAFAY